MKKKFNLTKSLPSGFKQYEHGDHILTCAGSPGAHFVLWVHKNMGHPDQRARGIGGTFKSLKKANKWLNRQPVKDAKGAPVSA